MHENTYDFPIAPPPGTQPDSTSSAVLIGYINQHDHNLLSDGLGVATERVNRRIRKGIILQSRQIALKVLLYPFLRGLSSVRSRSRGTHPGAAYPGGRCLLAPARTWPSLAVPQHPGREASASGLLRGALPVE